MIVKTLFVIGLALFTNAFSTNFDMRTNELTYTYTGAIGGKKINAIVICRPIKDTIINGFQVLKYRFIKQTTETADTSFDYLQITDSTVVNYAWIGNTPFVLLKRKTIDDTLRIEDTPYTTFAFPYTQNAQWLTRPESSGLQSSKQYVGQDTITIPAGNFYCNKVHTRILVTFNINDLYSYQWSNGNTVIKNFINEGENEVIDSTGNSLGKFHDWELFELRSFTIIDPVKTYENKIIKQKTNCYDQFNNKRVFTINGRNIKSNNSKVKNIYIIDNHIYVQLGRKTNAAVE